MNALCSDRRVYDFKSGVLNLKRIKTRFVGLVATQEVNKLCSLFDCQFNLALQDRSARLQVEMVGTDPALVGVNNIITIAVVRDVCCDRRTLVG